MNERFFRVEASGVPADELARELGTSASTLARWIAGLLPAEEADVIEVGLSLIERRKRGGLLPKPLRTPKTRTLRRPRT